MQHNEFKILSGPTRDDIVETIRSQFSKKVQILYQFKVKAYGKEIEIFVVANNITAIQKEKNDWRIEGNVNKSHNPEISEEEFKKLFFSEKSSYVKIFYSTKNQKGDLEV
jgi:peroxiredoxin family protein